MARDMPPQRVTTSPRALTPAPDPSTALQQRRITCSGYHTFLINIVFSYVRHTSLAFSQVSVSLTESYESGSKVANR